MMEVAGMVEVAGSYDLLFSGLFLEMKLLLCRLEYTCCKVPGALLMLLSVL